jgi:hypothetical protein
LRSRRWAVGLVLALALASCEETEKPNPLAQLVAAEGSVTVQRAGKDAPAAAGAPLFSGDALVTGPKSSARVRYRDGQEVDVAESTRFRIEEGLGKLTLTLEEGVVVSRAPAAKAPAGTRAVNLTILTPYGQATVTPGAEINVAVREKQSAIEVTQGEISVVGKDGKPLEVAAGQKVELEIGGIEVVPPPPKPEAPPSPPPQVAMAEPIELFLSAEAGTPQVRGKGDRRFARVTREPVAVAEGAQFKVPANARALLASKGMRVRLTGGAAGSVGAAVASEGKERYQLDLSSGEARVDFSGAGDRQLVLTGRGKKAVELHGSEEATAVVTRGARGLRVEVRSGEVELGSGEARKRVRAGEVADLSGGGLETAQRSRPQLLLPASRKVRVFSTGLPEVALAVSGGDEPVRVQVAADAAFSEVLLVGRAFGDYVVVNPPVTGDLHWRVLGADGNPAQRGHARFERDQGKSSLDLAHPRAEVAETGLKASVFFQSTLPEITFVSASREGAQKYRFRVYRAGEIKTPLAERTLTEPRCTLRAGELGEGDYLWYAAPLDGAGAELAGGRMNKLEIVYDNSRRTLAIARPKPGEPVGPDGVEAQGVAPLGSKLFVNGKPAPLDDKGRFSLRVPRTDLIVFRLVGDGGAESFWARKLGRRR